MLAELKSPAEKPVEKRSHRQHQYDVPREDNHMKVCNPYPLLLILLEVSINGKQAAVREYVCYLFGYGQTPVPSQDELQAFENGKDIGPTANSFRLDLASESLASKWNARAVEIFADVFLQEEELAEFLDRDAVIRFCCSPYHPPEKLQTTHSTCEDDRG
jgi:hypothetical protein